MKPAQKPNSLHVANDTSKLNILRLIKLFYVHILGVWTGPVEWQVWCWLLSEYMYLSCSYKLPVKLTEYFSNHPSHQKNLLAEGRRRRRYVSVEWIMHHELRNHIFILKVFVLLSVYTYTHRFLNHHVHVEQKRQDSVHCVGVNQFLEYTIVWTWGMYLSLWGL